VVGEALANGCAGDCQLEAILARLIVYADPSVQRNVHEIRVRGAVGDIQIEVRNAPSENPKTSQIVALSAVRAIRDLTAPVVIGA
jgi:aspartate dehydrogenase